MLVEHATQVDERIVSLAALRSTLATAVERLDALPDRDEPCDAGCTFLDGARPALPLMSEPATTIACSLDGDDYGTRVAEWRDLLADAPRAEVVDGVRVTLPATALTRAASLAQAEQSCCPFYTFRIDLHGPSFDLTITAPPEARAMLDDLLAAQEATR